MGNSTDQTTSNELVKTSKTTKSLKCLACGKPLKKPRRRYCSNGCHQKINWVLSLSKGLLKTFNARYAAFSFTDRHVMLDVLPAWSNVISRFVCERKHGNKPAEDLKYLVLQSGKEWYELIDNRKSKSYASLVLLDKSHNREIDPDSIKPNRNTQPRFSDQQKNCLKVLCINREELCSDSHTVKINSAYRKMAKVYHPDMGGDEEKFKQLNEAHKQMLSWAENPLFISRKALHNCWSYDASTNRWSPPL
jgi:hypothetical protein